MPFNIHKFVTRRYDDSDPYTFDQVLIFERWPHLYRTQSSFGLIAR